MLNFKTNRMKKLWVILSGIIVSLITIFFYNSILESKQSNDPKILNSEIVQETLCNEDESINDQHFKTQNNRFNKKEPKKFEHIIPELFPKPKPQFFTIQPDKDTVLHGIKGTSLYIPSHAFIRNDGTCPDQKIVFRLDELYSIQDFISTGAYTFCGEKQLVTGGSIYIDATEKGGEKLNLKKGKSIMVQFNTLKNSNKPMQVFYGEKNPLGVQWKLPKSSKNKLHCFTKSGEYTFKKSGNKVLVKKSYINLRAEVSCRTCGNMFLDYISFPPGFEEFTLKVNPNKNGVDFNMFTTTFQGKGDEQGVLREIKSFDLEYFKNNGALNSKQLKECIQMVSNTEEEIDEVDIFNSNNQYNVLSIEGLGWINCDIFLDDKNAKNIYVVDKQNMERIYVVFHKNKSVIDAKSFSNLVLPTHEIMSVFCIKLEANELKYSYDKVTFHEMMERNFIFKPSFNVNSEEEFLEILNNSNIIWQLPNYL